MAEGHAKHSSVKLMPAVSTILSKIVRSETFDNSNRLQELLSFVVREAADQTKPPVKATTIAYELYGRDIANDRRGGSIVRVDASRLRRKLELYYLTEGAGDKIRVNIPKGSYVPEFIASEKFVDQSRPKIISNQPISDRFAVTVTINSLSASVLSTLSQNINVKAISEEIQDALVVAIGRIPWLQVLVHQDQGGSAEEVKSNKSACHFVYEGRIRVSKSSLILLPKISTETGQKLWAERIQIRFPDADQELDAMIVQLGNILESKILSERTRITMEKPEDQRDKWDHYFAGLWYQSKRDKGSILQSFESLEKAVADDNNFYLAHAALAESCKICHIVDQDQDQSALASKALEAAKRALNTSQDNWLTHRAHGVALSLANNHTGAIEELSLAVKLNPNSSVTFFHLASAYLFAGELDDALSGFDMCLKLGPMDLYYSLVAGRKGMCLLLQGENEKAEKWASRAIHARLPLWPSYMIKTSALGHMKNDKAVSIRRELQKLKPGINCKLIASRYPDIEPTKVQYLLDGLRLAGLPD